MKVELVTKEDLQALRVELRNDIAALLGSPEPEPVREWLKSTEVRRLLKISAGTLQTLRVSGKLQFSKIGGTYYYPYKKIQQLLLSANPSR